VQYLLLIHSDEAAWNRLPADQVAEILGRYGATYRAMQEAGVIRAAHRLHSPASATTVRKRGGELLTTDGPIAELKEQLGGFFLIEVPDLDEAIRWAARLPASEYGAVEIRPIRTE
jgi:hypothetical protein